MKMTNFSKTITCTFCYYLLLTVTCHPKRNPKNLHHAIGKSIHLHKENEMGFINWENENPESDDSLYPKSHFGSLKENSQSQYAIKGSKDSWEDSRDEEDEYDEQHSYVMTKDHLTTSPPPPPEDQTLHDAFRKHMDPPGNSQLLLKPHDIYAYKLPSDLWFIVRYKRTKSGEIQKYMNIVSSFTNYLDKLDMSTKSVSVNVKGVETVFRLRSKP